MQTSKFGLRTLAVATAFGVALTAGATGAMPAVAQPISPAAASAPDVSTINKGARTSLTVHKRDLGNDTAVPGTGNEGQNAPGTPLGGATFELFRVMSADLSTNDGFAKAAALDIRDISENDLDSEGILTTREDGTIKFDGLAVGVYLLREIGAPAGYTPAQDSLVFLPMTNPDNRNEWNYNVHVYPKNSKTTAVKTVDDAGANVGDEITYTINSSIPSLTREGTDISKYEIHDVLDPRLSHEITGLSVGLTDGTSFSLGTEYEVGWDAATGTGSVRFLSAGLQRLTDAKKKNSSIEVETSATTTILKIDTGSGMITNQATVTSNNGGGGGDTTTPTNEVESHWGKLRVNKTGEEDKPLENSTFQLYRCIDQDNLEGPLTVGGKDDWTTDEEGTFTIDALQVTDFEDGREIDPTDKYCLVETKAPEGYELLPEPVEIDFTREAIAEESDTTGDDAVTRVAEIKSIKSVAAQLPLTGGAGVGLLAALGALIIGAGTWVARRLNRG